MPECKFGAKCYRKNEDHLKEFHPEKMKKEEDKKKESPETSTEKATKKRKMDEEPVKEAITQKRNAKIKKESVEDEENEKEDEEVIDEEFYEDCETDGIEEDEEETVQPNKRSSKRVLSGPHRTPFLHQSPSVYSFWKVAVQHEPHDPRNAYSEVNGMRLVGFYDFLAGDLKEATDDDIRIHARYATDLPEMQTIIVTNTGRYAIWRDDPKQTAESMMVYVKHNDEHFTKITMIGDKPIHALVHAAGEGAEPLLDKFFPSSEFKWATIRNLKHDVKTSIARRNKHSLGRPLHSMRLWVHVDSNDVGYRSLGEDLNKMKRTMTLVGDSPDDVVRKKKLAELREIGTYVQLAIDECDFGTGLEFGHDLFISNYPNLDAMAKRYLTMSYQLLGRDEFGAIVDAQMEAGVRRRQNVMIN